MAAKRTSKRKKYKLQDPKRFFGFIAILVLMVLLLVLVIRGCSGPKQQGGKQNQSSSQVDTSQTATVSTGLGDMQKQTIAWTVGLANMTRGISTAEPDDTTQVPKIYTIVIDPGCGGSDSGNPGHGNVVE